MFVLPGLTTDDRPPPEAEIRSQTVDNRPRTADHR
jgi:hypothetical protein